MPYTAQGKETADTLILTSQMEAAEGRGGRGVTAANYDTNYTLGSTEMQFAILYEIARSQNTSIASAADKCNLITLELESGPKARDQALGEALVKATPDKPSFILVNYNIAKEGSPYEPHWAVVAVSKDIEKRVTVTHMNSAVRPGLIRNSIVNGFIRDAVVNYSQTPGVKSVVEADKSRMIQHAHCCGLSCARACASFLAPNIAEVMGYNAELESSYAAQARRMYSMLQYSRLNSTQQVSEIEVDSLVESGVLTRDATMKVNDGTKQLETSKLLITQENLRLLKDMCNSHYEFNADLVSRRVQELFRKYSKPEGFDMAGAQYELVFESLSKVVVESGGNPKDYVAKYKVLLDKYNNDSFIVGNVLRTAVNMAKADHKTTPDNILKRAMEQVERIDVRAKEAAAEATEKSLTMKPVTKEVATSSTNKTAREEPVTLHVGEPAAKKAATDKTMQNEEAKIKWELKNMCLLVSNNDQNFSSSNKIYMLFLKHKQEYGGFDMHAAMLDIGVPEYLSNLRQGQNGTEVSVEEYNRVLNKLMGKIADNQYEASTYLREAKEELEGILRGEEVLKGGQAEVEQPQSTWTTVMKKAGELWQNYNKPPPPSESDKGR